MARCGMPEDTKRCPDCGETMVYSGDGHYAHVLRLGCPAFGATWKHGETLGRNDMDDVRSGNVWPEEVDA